MLRPSQRPSGASQWRMLASICSASSPARCVERWSKSLSAERPRKVEPKLGFPYCFCVTPGRFRGSVWRCSWSVRLCERPDVVNWSTSPSMPPSGSVGVSRKPCCCTPLAEVERIPAAVGQLLGEHELPRVLGRRVALRDRLLDGRRVAIALLRDDAALIRGGLRGRALDAPRGIVRA